MRPGSVPGGPPQACRRPTTHKGYARSCPVFFVRGLLMWLLVAALAIPAGGPATARDSGPADTEPDAARFLFDAPVAWNVFLQRTGEARHLAVDAARGRVLATAYVSASSDTRFFVLDFAGTELGNVSIGPWGASYGARIAVDPDTGYAYVSGDLGGIVKVDPSGPSVLARWSYDGFYPRAIAILGGVLYVTQDYDLGPGWPIAEIDAASGAYLGNLTAGPVGPAFDLLAEPTGR